MSFLEPGESTDRKSKTRQVLFTGGGGTFATWNALPDETMAYFLVIGSGGGGAGGFTGAAGGVRGGGGGGGSGAIARGLIPLWSLPGTLYIQPGTGGLGGAASSNGAVGQRSYVSIAPNTTAANIVMQSGAAAATAATAGSAAGSAAAGAAETISTVTLCIRANFGITQFIAGKVGAVGGVVGGAAGSANTLLTASQMNGGAGGGTTPAANTDFTGGAQTGAGIFPSIAGVTAGLSPENASGGYSYNGIFSGVLGYGGVGGGTSGASGVAARGGGGGFPGGGGGGGGGGVTGGAGGRGGDGCVLIVSW